jgi:hypothetical protein
MFSIDIFLIGFKICSFKQFSTLEEAPMWHKPFLLTAVGALLGMSTTVTTMLASILTPIISAVTSGKGSYS